MKNDEMIARVERRLGITGILDKLESLSPTDLQTLLLALYERKSSKITPASLFNQYVENRFVRPSGVSQRLLSSVERMTIDLLPRGFKTVELSPVAPFGVNSVLTRNNQKKIMSTVRNLEVCADSTTALIIECANQRKKYLREQPKNSEVIKLATHMRNIRLQNFESIPGFTPHFKALTLATAGRDCGSETFQTETAAEHLFFYLDLLDAMRQAGFQIENIRVSLSDIRITEKIISVIQEDRERLGLMTQDPKFDLFHHFGITFPPQIRSARGISPEFVRKYELDENLSFLSKIEKRITSVLACRFPYVDFSVDLGRIAGIGYYSDLCFKVKAHNAAGQNFPIVDGGVNDWTQQLLQSRKERAFASGVGTELLCQKLKS